MSEEMTVKKAFKNYLVGRMSALKMMRRKWVLRGWRKMAEDRDCWKLIVKETWA